MSRPAGTHDKDARIGSLLATAGAGGLPERMRAACEPMGLTRSASSGGETWEGEMGGYRVRIHASLRKRTRYAGEVRYSTYDGHMFEITARTSVRNRLVLSATSPFAGRMGARINRMMSIESVPAPVPALAHLVIFAAERTWANRFLSLPDIIDAIGQLAPADDLPPTIGIRLSPACWRCSQQISFEALTPEAVARWCGALLVLVRVAEQSPPASVIEQHWLERRAEQLAHNPKQGAWMLLALLTGVILVLGLIFSGLLVGLAVVMSG